MNISHGYGQPAVTPPLAEMWQVWEDITAAADIHSWIWSLQINLMFGLEQDSKTVGDSLFAYGQVNEDYVSPKDCPIKRKRRHQDLAYHLSLLLSYG